jgi:hypothetical protein
MKQISKMTLAEIAEYMDDMGIDFERWDRPDPISDICNRLRELNEHQEKINKFIRGEGDINGYHFGETPPNAPPFWWRKHLMTITQEDKP